MCFFTLAHSNSNIRLVTRTRGSFLSRWKLIAAMPVLTPAPFPNYDCRYHELEGRLQPMSHILPLEGNRTVTDYYGKRRDSDSIGTFRVEESVICDGDQHLELRFLNERHYEAVKVIGACREMQYLEAIAQNRDQYQTYYIRFDPLSLVHDDWEQTPRGSHYCLIDVRLQSARNLCGLHELEHPLPSLGSPVEITISTPRLSCGYLVFKGVTVRPPKMYHEATLGTDNPVCIFAFCRLPLFSRDFPARLILKERDYEELHDRDMDLMATDQDKQGYILILLSR
ncbi:hypothetical protein BJX70DRAFT_149626 [Aspergillus crustosus]